MMKSIWNMVVRYFRQTDKVIWGLCLTASAMSVVLLLGIVSGSFIMVATGATVPTDLLANMGSGAGLRSE